MLYFQTTVRASLRYAALQQSVKRPCASPRWLNSTVSTHHINTRSYSTTDTTLHSSVPTVVEPSWAADNISKFRVLDCSWYLNSTRNAYEEYIKQRIIGARFFSIDECSDKNSIYPHMLPDTIAFAFYNAHKLGIKHTDNLLLYDGHGMFSAPRVWLTYKIFGHSGKICVVNGGLPAWLAADLPLAHTEPKPPLHVSEYECQYNPDMVKQFDDIIENIQNQKFAILDARSAARFNGTAPEPRPIESGHVPHSISIPFTELLQNDGAINRLKSAEQLHKLFASKHVDVDRIKSDEQRIVTSCGSGVTASIISLALDRVGVPPTKVGLYDGSWSQYAHLAKTNKKAVIEKS